MLLCNIDLTHVRPLVWALKETIEIADLNINLAVEKKMLRLYNKQVYSVN